MPEEREAVREEDQREADQRRLIEARARYFGGCQELARGCWDLATTFRKLHLPDYSSSEQAAEMLERIAVLLPAEHGIQRLHLTVTINNRGF
jgi:hypothetical protein